MTTAKEAARQFRDLYSAIRQAREITDSVIVGFSGGKDSIVTLDLCVKHFTRVEAYFMYVVPDISFEERMLRWAEQHYNLDIFCLPNPLLSRMYHHGIYCLPDPNVRIVKPNDAMAVIRKHFDLEWIAGGEKRNDSLWRKGQISQGGVVNHKRRRFFPVADWTNDDIRRYMAHHRLPLSQDSRGAQTYLSFHGHTLYQLREAYPNDYAKVVRTFPLITAAVARYEHQLKNQVPDL